MSSMPEDYDMDSGALFRKAERSDVPFLLDSWMKSWRKCAWSGCIRNDMYYEVQRSTIEGLIARGAEFIVGCNPNNPDEIYGWICHEPGFQCSVIHYLYVKDSHDKYHLDRRLLERVPGSKPGFYTHRYRQVTAVCGEGWRHVPEVARRKFGARSEAPQGRDVSSPSANP